MNEITNDLQIDWLNLILSPIPFYEEYYDMDWDGVDGMHTWVEYMYGSHSTIHVTIDKIESTREYNDEQRKILNRVREDWIKWDVKNMWKEYIELPEE